MDNAVVTFTVYPSILTASLLDGPGLASTRMSPFWILLELRMTEVVVKTGARRRAKLQSYDRYQQTNTQLFTDRMPFLSPNQPCQSTEGKYHTLWTLSPQLT